MSGEKEEIGKVNDSRPIVTPTFLGVQLLKSGFIRTRTVWMTEATYEYSFQTERTYFKCVLVDEETHDRSEQYFDLEGAEAKELISFIEGLDTSPPTKMQWTVKLGVLMDARKKE